MASQACFCYKAENNRISCYTESENTMKFLITRRAIRIFIPQYDEIVLFTMSFTCILLLLTSIITHYNDIQLISPSEYDPRIIVSVFIFIAGLALSLYHAFTARPKTSLQKSFMLFFAVLVNAFSGFMASGYDLAHARGWLIAFPIMNIINCVILLFMWRSGVLDESSISDQHAPSGKILLSATMVLLLYYLCHFIYNFPLIQTLSICLVYSVNFIRLFEMIILRPPTSGTTV